MDTNKMHREKANGLRHMEESVVADLQRFVYISSLWSQNAALKTNKVMGHRDEIVSQLR